MSRKVELELPDFEGEDLVVGEDSSHELFHIAAKVVQERKKQPNFGDAVAWLTKVIAEGDVEAIGFEVFPRVREDSNGRVTSYHEYADEPEAIPEDVFRKIQGREFPDDLELNDRRNKVRTGVRRFEQLQVNKKQLADKLEMTVTAFNLRARTKPGQKRELLEFWIALAMNAKDGNLVYKDQIRDLMSEYDFDDLFLKTKATQQKYVDLIARFLDL